MKTPYLTSTLTSTSGIASGETFLSGDVMYLFPSNLGDYADLDAVITATPEGGTLYIMDSLNLTTVNSDAPLTIPKPMRVLGWGWGFNGSTRTGTTITNSTSGTDCILLFDSSSSPGARCDGWEVGNLYIQHNGTSAGVFVQGTASTYLHDLNINCASNGAIGIDVDNDTSDNTFFVRGDRIRVRDFKTNGIRDKGAGTQNIWRDIHIVDGYAGGVPDCGIMLAGSDKRLLGGEYSCAGLTANTRTGVKVFPVTGASSGNGCAGTRVEDFLFEGDSILYCIQIGGVTSGYIGRGAIFSNNQCQGTNGQIMYRFEYAERCEVRDFVNYTGSNYRDLTLAEFSANSNDNVVTVIDPTFVGKESDTIRERTWPTDAGTNNTVRISGPCTDAALMAVNSVVPASVNVQAMIPADRNLAWPILRTNGIWRGTYLDPDSVTSASCLLWLDADTGLYSDAGTTAAVDTDGVYQWEDVLVGTRSSNIFVQTTSGQRPIYDADVEGRGVPGVLFTSTSSQELVGPVIALGGSTGTIVAVGTFSGTGTISNKAAIGRDGSSANTVVFFNSTTGSPDTVNIQWRFRDNTSNLSTLSNSPTSAIATTLNPDGSTHSTFVLIGTYDKSASPPQTSWLNTRTATVTDATDDWLASSEANAWAVGSSNGAFYFDGWIHAVALFDDVLSDQDISDLGFYFANKYRAINGAA